MLENYKVKKEYLVIFYKLLHDTLFIFLAMFVLALIAEGLLPGIVSSRMGLGVLLLLTAGNFFAIYLAATAANLDAPNYTVKKTTFFLFLFLLLLLVLNSALKVHTLITITITLSVAIGGYYLYKIVEEEIERNI